MKRLTAAIVAAVLAFASLTSAYAPARAQEVELNLPRGRFYTQASGDSSGRLGFPVIDDNRGNFWAEFQRIGGPQVVGYPISRRFTYGGFETQAFQKLFSRLNATSELNTSAPAGITSIPIPSPGIDAIR